MTSSAASDLNAQMSPLYNPFNMVKALKEEKGSSYFCFSTFEHRYLAQLLYLSGTQITTCKTLKIFSQLLGLYLTVNEPLTMW